MKKVSLFKSSEFKPTAGFHGQGGGVCVMGEGKKEVICLMEERVENEYRYGSREGEGYVF